MEPKKMIGAWIGSFVVMFLLSFLWYGLLMEEFYAATYAEVNLPMEDFSMTLIVVGYLIQAFMLSYIFPIGFGGGSAVKEGLRFGLILGMLFALPGAFILAAVYKMPLEGNLIDAAYHIVEFAAGGIVIAKIYGSGAEAPESSTTEAAPEGSATEAAPESSTTEAAPESSTTEE